MALSPVYCPAATMALANTADSVCRWINSTPCGDAIMFTGDCVVSMGVSVAAVTRILKRSTVTLAGGLSWMLRLTGTLWPIGGWLPVELDVAEEPHPARTHESPTARQREAAS